MIRFRNDLPEIPCDPKLLLPSTSAAATARFCLTSLERDFHCEPSLDADLGLDLPPLDAEAFEIPERPGQLDPRDAVLLATDDEGTAAASGHGRQGELSWLLRTSYLSSGKGSSVAPKQVTTASAAAAETRVSLEERIASIEETFEAARRPPVHGTRPDLQPVEILPLLPDEVFSNRSLVLTFFDSDPVADIPALAGASPEDLERARASLQLKSFSQRRSDGSSDQFVALLYRDLPPGAPVPVTPEEIVGDYLWVREYSAVVDYGGRNFYLFRSEPDHIGYSRLGTKSVLRKRMRTATDNDGDRFLQPEKVRRREDRRGGEQVCGIREAKRRGANRARWTQRDARRVGGNRTVECIEWRDERSWKPCVPRRRAVSSTLDGVRTPDGRLPSPLSTSSCARARPLSLLQVRLHLPPVEEEV